MPPQPHRLCLLNSNYFIHSRYIYIFMPMHFRAEWQIIPSATVCLERERAVRYFFFVSRSIFSMWYRFYFSKAKKKIGINWRESCTNAINQRTIPEESRKSREIVTRKPLKYFRYYQRAFVQRSRARSANKESPRAASARELQTSKNKLNPSTVAAAAAARASARR